MVNLFFDCGWKSSRSLLDGYLKFTHERKGVWGNLRGVYTLEEADVVIFIGSYTGKNYPGKPVVQLRREPDSVERFIRHPQAKAILDYNDNDPRGYHACTWEMEWDFGMLQDMKYPSKSKKASLISTDKWAHRNDIVAAIANAVGDQVDYFGIGMQNIVGPSLYKGQLNFPKDKCKMPGLKDYHYSIAIENSKQVNYFSEKIIDCYLGWTFPIYWGCPNIDDFFPKGSYIDLEELSGRSLERILNTSPSSDQINILKECRDLVLHKYSLWPTLERIINTI